MNKILKDEQWYSYYVSKASNRNYNGYPIYFELDNILYLQPLDKYNGNS